MGTPSRAKQRRPGEPEGAKRDSNPSMSLAVCSYIASIAEVGEYTSSRSDFNAISCQIADWSEIGR